MTDRSDLPKRGDRYVLSGRVYRVTNVSPDGEVSLSLLEARRSLKETATAPKPYCACSSPGCEVCHP